MTDDPYLIPGTQTLRNLAGITDPDELARFEHTMAIVRTAQLESGEVRVPGQWDLAHLQAFHRHIFGDVYDWAGELRTVEIAKGNTLFALARFVVSSADELFDDLAGRGHLRNLDRNQFVAGAAHVLAELNTLHPFREGNGRTQRAFVSQLANNAGWHVDWTGARRSSQHRRVSGRHEG